ncbi:MAG: DUF262 domain-containing protein [Bacilli bacterium]|nr:DUF262 domain-containing protein [Bacilli bacterium]
MAEMHYKKQDYNIEQFDTWVLRGKLNLSPEYQRDYVYTLEQASKLIESALMNIPLPIIYLCEEGNGTYSVIDGQQRITSFLKFKHNEFPLTKLSVYEDLNGKYYKDLSDADQDKIDNTALMSIIIEADSAESKFDIFERLNKGAVTLKEQELRNCVFRGEYNSMINDIAASNKTVRKMFKAENKRMWYQEYILRFFALNNFTEYKPSMKSWLNKYMKANQFNTDTIQADKDRFNKTLSIVNEALGDDAFATVDYDKKITLNKFSATFYDSIMVAFSKFDRVKLISKADSIRAAINDTKFKHDEYHDACYAATGSRERVIKRILIIYNIVNSIVGDSGVESEERTFDPALKQPLAEKQNYICPLCGNQIVSLDECEIDHILPYSLGGKTVFENAQLVHKICNRHKSNNVKVTRVLESIGASDTYRMSEEKDIRGKKITMFTFRGKQHLVSHFYRMFQILLDEIKDIIPGKFEELADEEFKLTKRSIPYIKHTKEGMYNPYEVVSGVFVECAMDVNRLMAFARAIFDEFNLDSSEVVLTFKGNEDDDE